jgi:hypothetical protein
LVEEEMHMLRAAFAALLLMSAFPALAQSQNWDTFNGNLMAQK